jgi:small conductance mechanosensitive channel
MALLQQPNWDAFWAWMNQVGWHKLYKLSLVVLTCILLLWAVKLVARAVRRAVDDGHDDVTTEAERRADTLGSVLNNTARVLVAAFFLLMTLQEFGVNIGPLVAGAGVAGVALGFGAQSLVKDVIAGFFLLLENQFGVGDIISVDDGKHQGTVERMTLRVTQLRDTEGRAHYLPNGSITKAVVLSKEFARALVDVEVGYDVDLDRVFSLLREVGSGLHKDWPEVVLEPMDVKGVEAFGKDGCMVRTLTKTAPGKQWDVQRELRRRIIQRFRAEGIASPIPQRIVHTRNPFGASTASESLD